MALEFFLLLFLLLLNARRVSESVAVIAGLDDVTMMGQPTQEGGARLRIAGHR